MAFETILLEKKNGVARITLNRPEVLNAFNQRMSDELKEAVSAISSDYGIKVVVITGAGGAFMSGADIAMLQWYTNIANKEGAVRKIFEASFSPTMLERLPQPVIAAVNGHAFGMGCEIALGCDLRIASENAQFGQLEIKLGIMTGAGGSVRLTRMIGKTKAMEMILTGKRIGSLEALRLGLLNRVVPANELEQAVSEMIADLVDKSPIALRYSKSSINIALEAGFDKAIDNELALFCEVIKTRDAREGVSAFLQKRKPRFLGR